MATHTNNDAPAMPQTDKDAIKFALNHIDPLQIADFLRDWLDGESLKGWLDRDRSEPEMEDALREAAALPPFGDLSMSDAEMLALLKYPELAMSFALDHLQPLEIRDFIRDWKQGVNLAPWLRGWRQNPPTT